MKHTCGSFLQQAAIDRGLEHIAEKKIDAQVLKPRGIAFPKRGVRPRGMGAVIEQGREARRQVLHVAKQQPEREKSCIFAPHPPQAKKLALLCAVREKTGAEGRDGLRLSSGKERLRASGHQQHQRQPVADRAAAVLRQRDRGVAEGAHGKIQRGVERVRRGDGFSGLLREEGNGLRMLQKQPRRLRAGDAERDLLYRAVFLKKTGVAGADAAEPLLSELRLKRAETVLCQQDAFAVIAEAEAGLAVLHGKSVLQPLAELACDRAVKRHCVLVNDNLPVFAAGVGAVACQTVKLRVKIGVDLLHAQRLLSLCHHTQFRAARQYCYFPQRVI